MYPWVTTQKEASFVLVVLLGLLGPQIQVNKLLTQVSSEHVMVSP